MGYFKRFTDFCSGFSAFTAIMFLFRRYMTYKFEDDVLGIREKLKIFFAEDINEKNHWMLLLAIVFILSVIGGRVLSRYPHLATVFTVPPLLVSVDMVKAELIEEYPMLYVILAAVAVLGGVVDCMLLDRDDGKHRSAYSCFAIGLMFSAFLLYVARRSVSLAEVDTTAVELGRFDKEIFMESANADMKVFYVFAAVYAVLAILCTVLADVYFLDGLLALPPTVALIYNWGAGKLTVHAEMVVTFAVVYLAVCAVPAISGKAFYRQKPKKE